MENKEVNNIFYIACFMFGLSFGLIIGGWYCQTMTTANTVLLTRNLAHYNQTTGAFELKDLREGE